MQISKASYSNANGLKLGLGVGRDGDRRCTLVVEGTDERVTNDGHIGVSNTERGRRQTDILNEPAELTGVQSHVLVHRVHAGVAAVLHRSVGKLRAAEQAAEVLVQVSEQEVLRALGVVGRQVLLQGSSSSTIKEVHRNAGATTLVGRVECAGEVGQQIDTSILAGARGEETRHCNADVGLRVVADDRSVHHQGQERLLVGGVVVLQESGGLQG